jgi:hypothetical protein
MNISADHSASTMWVVQPNEHEVVWKGTELGQMKCCASNSPKGLRKSRNNVKKASTLARIQTAYFQD